MSFTFEPYRRRWQEAFNRGDMAAVAELYSHDAVFFNFDGRMTKGRQDIRTALEGTLEELQAQVPGKHIRFDSDITEEEILGGAGYLIGTYRYLLPDDAVLMAGFYTVIGKKVGNDWRIARHMNTAKIPTPAEPKKMAAV